MMFLQWNISQSNLTVRFSSRDISFEIKRGEHVAVIGDNGTGKDNTFKDH